MRKASARQENFYGRGRDRFPGSPMVESGGFFGYVSGFSPGWIPEHPAPNTAQSPTAVGPSGGWRPGNGTPRPGGSARFVLGGGEGPWEGIYAASSTARRARRTPILSAASCPPRPSTPSDSQRREEGPRRALLPWIFAYGPIVTAPSSPSLEKTLKIMSRISSGGVGSI
jgi:hypothetical protein